MLSTQMIRETVAKNFPQTIDHLSTLVAIPSVSSDPEHAQDVEKAAEYLSQELKDLGCEARVVTCKDPLTGLTSRPAVIAEKKAVLDPQGAPTVLLYAHHDVQPTGDISTWHTPPFEATRKGERLFGRGTADDGAGVVAHLATLAALGDDLPVNLRIFIEGEEEIGSPTFEAFLKEFQEELQADVIIVADSSNWKVGIPALTTTLRGIGTLDVTVEVLEHAVHSGMFGGPLLDAPMVMARLLSTLHDNEGAVCVPGLLGTSTSDVTYAEEDFKNDAGAVEGLQLVGKGDVASRLWTQPAISLIGMDVTSVDASSNSIIPKCRARLSLRVAPMQQSSEAIEALVKHLHAHIPFGAKLHTSIEEAGPGYLADTTTRTAQAASWALSTGFGKDCVQIGQGGSIPFVSTFAELMPGSEVLVTGVEDPNSQAHSENESVHLGDLEKVIVSQCLLLARLAGKL
ncbi:MAG: dipeptidase [Actinomycetaceae bacterium]|nr:dipeptidase [Actinomycetaceae bacterium]